jgi:monovalent cation/hydrogen antiporter
MGEPELQLLVLMVAVGALSVLAGVVRVPYPIVLVLGGLVLGFVPGVPRTELQPNLVLLLFLPRCCTRRRSFPHRATCAPTRG